MAEARIIEPDMEFINEIDRLGGDTLKKCYQCATCSVVCNLSPEDKPFPRKEMIMAQWGQIDQLAKDPDIWLCYQCNDCSVNCPRGAKPGDVLSAIRSYIYKAYAIPSFMGKALANPKALPILLLAPVLILLGLMFGFAPRANGKFVFLTANPIDYNLFLPHSAVDVLFVFGMILVVIFAIISLSRFWKNLHADGADKSLSFIQACKLTLVEIIMHGNFFKCDTNKSRSWGHVLLLIGFAGSFIATALVFVLHFIPHYLELLGITIVQPFFPIPREWPHIVKISGLIGGIAILIGGIMLLYRHWTNKENVGANSYTDSLFLYIVFFVGLTGMLSWLTRLANIPMLACANYFLHLVAVFFLLIYMPYSKFAHMFYRTLALIYCRSIGREARSKM
ncbi:MAG: quinone-interacting membrane-bound oxidoreductase complex subunit QmoC [candidate division Zixibacteria bacterium]|nr:quinone-interacting membrane-bound oxidoreductase complex subunit QmoC [candidate division Zixibacteria bacterium]